MVEVRESSAGDLRPPRPLRARQHVLQIRVVRDRARDDLALNKQIARGVEVLLSFASSFYIHALQFMPSSKTSRSFDLHFAHHVLNLHQRR